MVLHEALRPYEKLEGMPACLLVVDELAFGDASETRHAEQALRVIRHEAICFPEEHDGSIEQPAMLDQVESDGALASAAPALPHQNDGDR